MPSGDDVQLRTLTPRPTVSPACDALRGNLQAIEADQGLKEKKSWFNSMRDVFREGALRAKAAVDLIRSEPKPATHADDSLSLGITTEPRPSWDSAASTTPLKSHDLSPQLHRRRTFSLRAAASSLRQHLPGSRSKRGSIYSIIPARNSTDAQIPEQYTSIDGRQSGEIEQHGRKGSIASSLVGSIRGLAHRRTKSHPATSAAQSSAPVDPAKYIPLPSSPINIPSAAPVLGLDLGQPGMNLLPAELAGDVTDTARHEDTRKLQDPAIFAFGRATARQSSLPLVPDELKRQFTHPAIRASPILPSLRQHGPSRPNEVPLENAAENMRPSPPAAPRTPLPGASLGMELDGADNTASSGEKSQVFERSVTPTNEQDCKEPRKMCSLDAIADAYTTACKDSGIMPCDTVHEEGNRLSPDPDPSPMSNPFSPRGSIPSASTVSECPSDMPQLARQQSIDSRYYNFGNFVEDPFDDSHVASHGPPSPIRSVRLPLRPKAAKGPSDDSAASCEAALSSIASGDLADDPLPETQYTFEVQKAEDDTLTSSLWNSHVVYPAYEDYPLGLDEASDDGMSPHGGPMVPFGHGDPTHSQSTWKAGLGSDGFKFSIDTWRRPGPIRSIPRPQPQTSPGRRAEAMSIDSVSAEGCFSGPASMGDKQELDLRRSERNMRYNALCQQQQQAPCDVEIMSSSPARMHARFVDGGSSGDMDPNEAQHSIANARSPSRERISSEDSMTTSLRSASNNMERLRALLCEIDSDGEQPGEQAIVDAFTTASSPRSKRPVGRKGRDVRSDSPSPSSEIATTPVLEATKFSPTTARNNASPNRFAVLDEIISSPATDRTATAVALPFTIQHYSKENRHGLADTLDKTIDMLSSPDSGYKADDSSELEANTPSSISEKQIPRRYRSQRKGRNVLGDISGNRV